MRRRPSDQALPLALLLDGALPPPVKGGLLLADLSLKWKDVVGPLAARSRPHRIEEGLLIVIVESPALAQRLRIQSGTVARKIREGWGLPVTGLRAVVGPVSSVRKRMEAVRPSPSGPLQIRKDELEAARERIAPHVEDEKISSALARLLAVYRRRFGGGSPRDGATHPTKE